MPTNLTTSPTNSPAPLESFWQGIVKALPSALLAATLVLAGFLWNANNSVNDYRRRIEVLEAGKETNAKGIAEGAAVNHSFAIKFAENTVVVQGLVIAITDLKTENRELKTEVRDLKARLDGRK